MRISDGYRRCRIFNGSNYSSALALRHTICVPINFNRWIEENAIHCVRVKTVVLLHEVGQSSDYIKLRIRWLSDCFQVYLRNTRTISEQHNAALMSVNEIIVNAITMGRIRSSAWRSDVYCITQGPRAYVSGVRVGVRNGRQWLADKIFLVDILPLLQALGIVFYPTTTLNCSYTVFSTRHTYVRVKAYRSLKKCYQTWSTDSKVTGLDLKWGYAKLWTMLCSNILYVHIFHKSKRTFL